MYIKAIGLCLGMISLLSACSSGIPIEIREPIAGSPGIEVARASPDQFQASRVRWGGVIAAIENSQDSSRLTVIGLPLTSSGRPRSSDDSPGRFIAVVDEFLEPLVYGRNRKITVVGSINGSISSKVGEFPYDYPLVKVSSYHLWPVQTPVVIERVPSWYHHDYWPVYAPYPWRYPYRPLYRTQKKKPAADCQPPAPGCDNMSLPQIPGGS